MILLYAHDLTAICDKIWPLGVAIGERASNHVSLSCMPMPCHIIVQPQHMYTVTAVTVWNRLWGVTWEQVFACSTFFIYGCLMTIGQELRSLSVCLLWQCFMSVWRGDSYSIPTDIQFTTIGDVLDKRKQQFPTREKLKKKQQTIICFCIVCDL